MQTEQPKLSALIGSLDEVHTRSVQRAAYFDDFQRLCPSSVQRVPIDIFVNHCTGVLGLSFKGSSNVGSTLARCAYDACLMMTETQGMCKIVYLIFRAAFTAFDSVRDGSTILLWIRLRAVFLMYSNEHQQLPYSSAKKLVDDLVLTSEHLQPIYHTLRLEPGMRPWSWESFSNRDILGSLFSASRLPRSGGSNLKPFTLTAKSKGVSLEPGCKQFTALPIKLQPSTWKGALVNEQHPSYKFATMVLHNAKRMYPPESPWLDRIDWESSIVDDGFRNFTPCCPLAFLTSLRSMDEFMNTFDELASEARRIVSMSPPCSEGNLSLIHI